jgi:radical SAM-linked protein
LVAFSRILFRFAKKGDARHLSHRDLMRLFERALRRGGLPVRMSQGFNPHPRLSILAALPVGIEAEDEALELEFEPPVPASEARGRLAAQLPRGIALHAAHTLPEGVRPRVASVAYEAELPEGLPELGQADVARFLAREAIGVSRGSGSERAEVDLRPALRAMSVEGRRLRFELAVADRGTPRASEVLAALLGAGPAALAAARVRRIQVNLALAPPRHPSGTAVPPLSEGNEHAT